MPYDLVVIGASVGGLHALIALLEGLPPTFPLPLVLVQHRSADTKSSIRQVLQQHTGLTVVEAEDKDPISRGRLYIAPADYHLLIEPNRTLALSTDEPVLCARPSVDALFESAAEVYREKLVAVLLTGASADGARGVRRVKQCGGWVIVQDPATAESRVMPEAALTTVRPDEVVALDRIAASLRQLAVTA